MNSPFPPSACSHAGMSSGAGEENEPPGADVVVVDAADGPPFDEHATRLYVARAAATPPALRRKARRSTPPADDGVALPDVDPTGPPGSFAAGILSPAPSTEIDVDVRAQSSAVPRSDSIDHVLGMLRDASGKAVTPSPLTAIGGDARTW